MKTVIVGALPGGSMRFMGDHSAHHAGPVLQMQRHADHFRRHLVKAQMKSASVRVVVQKEPHPFE